MQTIRSLLTINERDFELLLNVTVCAFYSTELPDFCTICPSYKNFRKISDLLNFRNANRSTYNSGNSDKKLKFNGYSGEKISKILRVVYTLRGCPFWGKFQKMPFYLPVDISVNLTRSFSWMESVFRPQTSLQFPHHWKMNSSFFFVMPRANSGLQYWLIFLAIIEYPVNNARFFSLNDPILPVADNDDK